MMLCQFGLNCVIPHDLVCQSPNVFSCCILFHAFQAPINGCGHNIYYNFFGWWHVMSKHSEKQNLPCADKQILNL